jgi:hypothetical protein
MTLEGAEPAAGTGNIITRLVSLLLHRRYCSEANPVSGGTHGGVTPSCISGAPILASGCQAIAAPLPWVYLQVTVASRRLDSGVWPFPSLFRCGARRGANMYMAHMLDDSMSLESQSAT